MILLDLYSEGHPVWSRTNAYYGKPWIWNMLQNFGGNVSLYGRMRHVAADPAIALRDPESKNMVGIGLAPEAIEQNPALYGLMLENVWRDNPIDAEAWLKDYGERRYGKNDPQIDKAWEILLNTVYSGAAGHGGPASIIAGRPTLNMGNDWRVDTNLHYSPKQLIKAWRLFMRSADDLKQSDGFQYDVVDITRQVLANYANTIQPEIIKAYQSGDLTGFKKHNAELLTLMDDMDELLATRKDFLLGKWIHDARANGITPQESDIYEFNARDLVTLWGGRDNPLSEYSNRQWAGLIKGYYKPRWQMFFEGLEQSLINKAPLDTNTFEKKIKDWEWAWVHQHDTYADKVTGNSVEEAKKMFKKYDALIEETYK